MHTRERCSSPGIAWCINKVLLLLLATSRSEWGRDTCASVCSWYSAVARNRSTQYCLSLASWATNKHVMSTFASFKHAVMHKVQFLCISWFYWHRSCYSANENGKKGNGSFYIAQYPVRWTAQSALHFLPPLTDLFIPTPTRLLREAVSILGFENCQSFFSYNCPCTYGVPQCAAHRIARRAPVWLSQHLPNSQNSCGTSHTDNCLINTPYCHACF